MLWLASPVVASDCLVIAHRGASGYLPEHTLEAYRLGIEMGADYIEPDLVITRDGVPIARHESALHLTTDVADRPEFADRRRTQVIGSQEIDGWFVEDFYVREIQTLRATERFAEVRGDNVTADADFAVPTLQQVIDLVADVRERTGRVVGLYPELKQPAYFLERGHDIVRIVLATLYENGFNRADDPVLVQSFDPAALIRASESTELRLVQLLWVRDAEQIAAAVAPAALRDIARYAVGIGVAKYGYIMEPLVDETAIPRATSLIRDAHAAGLFVHGFTFRAENHFLPTQFDGDGSDRDDGRLVDELRLFLRVGMDGFFTDQPDVGRRVCDEFKSG